MTVPAQFSADDIEEIREQLEPFSFAGAGTLPDSFARYARFYGIDFENRYPVSHRAGSLKSNDYTLSVQHWLPERPKGTVFVVHGYFDHVGIYGHLIEYFLARNYAVVTYDQPGHGLSDGEPVSIGSFGAYVDALADVMALCLDECSRPWHIVAQSMGSAVVMTYLLKGLFPSDGVPFSQVVLLAPLVYPKGWGRGRWLHLLLRRLVKARPREFVINSHDPEFVDFTINRDPLQSRQLPMQWVTALKEWIADFLSLHPCSISPVVIQGTEDETVDWTVNMREVMTKFPGSTTHYVTGARHHLVNESEELRAKIFALLDDRF